MGMIVQNSMKGLYIFTLKCELNDLCMWCTLMHSHAERVLDIQCELKWHVNPSAKVPVYAAIICEQHLFHSGIYYFGQPADIIQMACSL